MKHAIRLAMMLLVTVSLSSSLFLLVAATAFADDPEIRSQPSSADATTEPSFTLVWSAPELEDTRSVAWADYDRDGDLDLATGNCGWPTREPNRLYRNDKGVLSQSAVWSSTEADCTLDLDWGDYDGDGDLDLAAGNQNAPNRLYRNDHGNLTRAALWSADQAYDTRSIAWGDYDGDGDLDLAVGNWRQPNQLYRNDNGMLSLDPAWSPLADNTRSVAWGDYDRDGDLDLVVGNGAVMDVPIWDPDWGDADPIRLFRNDSGVLNSTAIWSSSESYYNTSSVAWGDWDGDGDLDLAAGADTGPRGNRVYRNEGGTLSAAAVWQSDWSYGSTSSVAWGDYDRDGDLDLIAGTYVDQDDSYGMYGVSNWLYRNDDGVLTASPAWSSEEEDHTTSVAWGDYDGDGDLDLAAGNLGPSRVYRNNADALTESSVIMASIASRTDAVAWGDVDSDGDLDLAAGNELFRNDNGTLTDTAVWTPTDDLYQGPVSLAWGDVDGDGDLDLASGSRLYRNEGGVLTDNAVWSPAHGGWARIVAWGDYDGDGDLDLAVAGGTTTGVLYRNDGGVLTTDPVWSSDEDDYAQSVAWGDYDRDGDLDLAFGRRLYRNDGGVLTASAVWSPCEADHPDSVAWGDVDGDGDLDLATGTFGQRNRVYRNDYGVLTACAAWSSDEIAQTTAVAWWDYDGDGDLDLVSASDRQPERVYRNDRGVLTDSAAWSFSTFGKNAGTTGIALGDYDSDGDVDLAFSGYVMDYGVNVLFANTRNTTASPGLPGSGKPATVRLVRPSPPANADHYSAPNIWPGTGSSIAISYTLSQPDSRPVGAIRAYYSPDGGGAWLPAVVATDTITTNLATSPAGINYTYNWDVFASGFFGQSDNVVFRIVVLPDLHPVADSVPGPFLFGNNASVTFPFRVRGTQVRVMEDGAPVQGALVYQLTAGQTGAAKAISSLSGEPFKTDSHGYLQGRGAINVGDRLLALAPITATSAYTLYHTNATPTATGLDTDIVQQPGVQTLAVSSPHPLVLFNLDISLEWDARQDAQFLSQLNYDLERASEFLYDWSNGQAALGQISVYHDRELWQDAHIRIYATNRLRPSAVMGGIVSEPISETVPITASTVITYGPGQLYMGATWNRYGESGSSLDEDWPRTLSHELGHYALFLEDNYLGLDDAGLLMPVDSCPGAMADPYRDDAAAGYGEFHPDTAWLPSCAQTLSNRQTGRSDWATITSFYPQLDVTDNPGPSSLPLDVTQVQFVEPATPMTTIKVPIFYLSQDGHRVQPGSSARAFLFRDGWATDLGRATLDQLLARGARPGDRVCLYELAAGRLGCETVTLGDEQLALTSVPGWQPEIAISPVTSRTFTITVAAAPPGLTLTARLYPADVAAGAPITLAAAGAEYTGTFNLAEPTFAGYVHVLVDEVEPRREAVVDFTLGGNPGHQRSGGGHQRSGGGHQRSGGAPVMSADGQVILFAPDVTLPTEWFYTLQATSAGIHPPPWATLVGQAYRLAASANAPDLAGTSLSFSYLGGEVPTGEEDWLKLYFRDGNAWRQLPTQLDTYHNMASAATQGPGVYALMSSIEVELDSPGWNWFAYPVSATRPITDALISVTGYYTTVYSYQPASAPDPWKVYDVTAPAWVNDLPVLEFAHAYWINVSQPLTVRLRGTSAAAAGQSVGPDRSDGIPLPPALYYGRVLGGPGFTPAAGMPVTAKIGDAMCGSGRTRLVDGAVVYSVKVLAAGSGAAAGCGVEGRRVTFIVGSQEMATTATWDTSRVWQRTLSLNPDKQLYLPIILTGP